MAVSDSSASDRGAAAAGSYASLKGVRLKRSSMLREVGLLLPVLALVGLLHSEV